MLRRQDLQVLQAQPVGDLAVDPFFNIVEIGMDGINGNIMPDRLHHYPFDIGFTVEFFQSGKNYRVMRDHQVGPFFDGFIDHGFCTVEADDRRTDLHAGMSNDQS
jgi:hypothetical protein